MLTRSRYRCCPGLPFSCSIPRRRSIIIFLSLLSSFFFINSQLTEPIISPFDPNAVSFRLANSNGDVSKRPWAQAKSVGRVFIAATHWNSEKILEQHWIPAVLSIILTLGRENVFISIGVSPGGDNTFNILRKFDKQLGEMGVGRKFVFGTETHAQLVGHTPPPLKETSDEDTGWILSPTGHRELRRIPYLAKLRNEVLEPLGDRKVVNSTQTFNKILWLNDVVFTSQDALELLTTRQGNYAAACALDFNIPGLLYDTFATRDSTGREIVSLKYPFFGAGESRDAFLSSLNPFRTKDEDTLVPVQSCWNGLTAFDAEPFLDTSSKPPLRFRGIPDSLASLHLEGSECCLVHADNPLSPSKGVWVNPKVRVGYDEIAYLSARTWPSRRQRVTGWFIRAGSRLLGLPWKKRKVERKVLEWEAGRPDREEAGKFCLVDEMQLMAANGWKHV